MLEPDLWCTYHIYPSVQHGEKMHYKHLLVCSNSRLYASYLAVLNIIHGDLVS